MDSLEFLRYLIGILLLIAIALAIFSINPLEPVDPPRDPENEGYADDKAMCQDLRDTGIPEEAIEKFCRRNECRYYPPHERVF